MMNSNLNLSALPECKFAYQMVNSALLIPCAEYQRVLHVEKVAHIAETFSEYERVQPGAAGAAAGKDTSENHHAAGTERHRKFCKPPYAADSSHL